MPKTRQQEAQEKRLQRNVKQAKKTRTEARKAGSKTASPAGPKKKPGFFSGLKADAPQTVQQSIPYKEMYRDGICRVSGNYYTKTVQFFDINYQLAQADDKAQIFEGYCDFLNYFDASIHVQLTFINQRANMQDFVHSIEIPARGDEYDGIRREYADMLKNQLQKGNNGLTKRKYITFGIEAEDLRTAKMRLERIETDVLGNFKALGVQARPLNGLERLELLHSQLHPDGQEKLHFNWSDLPKTGLSTKDYIAPSGLSFSQDGKTFRVGDHSGAVSFLQILAPELTDRLLAELLDLDDAVTINLHIQSIDQAQAIKNIKRKMSDLQKMTIEEQKKAVRSGYDMDIIKQFGAQGQVIDISPNSTNYINPMDINLDYSDDENPITLKSDFTRVPFEVSDLMDYRQVKPMLAIRLCDPEQNREYLKDKPFTPCGELAAVYRIQVMESKEGVASAVVTDRMMELWGVTKEQLHQDAVAAETERSPVCFYSMEDMMDEIMFSSKPENLFECTEPLDAATMPMYVLTNASKVNGSGILARDGVLDKIGELLGKNFYVLPSSIHEVLIVPDNGDMQAKELESMVKEVNATQVAPADLLSDKVQYYDRAAKTLGRKQEKGLLERLAENKAQVKEQAEKAPKEKTAAKQEPSL